MNTQPKSKHSIWLLVAILALAGVSRAKAHYEQQASQARIDQLELQVKTLKQHAAEQRFAYDKLHTEMFYRSVTSHRNQVNLTARIKELDNIVDLLEENYVNRNHHHPVKAELGGRMRTIVANKEAILQYREEVRFFEMVLLEWRRREFRKIW